jgi:hypothetical protein
MPSLELKEKIWGTEPYPSVVRIIGYAGITVDAFEERIKPLNEEYGHTAVHQARVAVASVDYSKKPHVMHLRSEIRSVVHPLLGPDPQNPPWWHTPPKAEAELARPADPKPTKRKRKQAKA